VVCLDFALQMTVKMGHSDDESQEMTMRIGNQQIESSKRIWKTAEKQQMASATYLEDSHDMPPLSS
jgi:hypothetical protein